MRSLPNNQPLQPNGHHRQNGHIPNGHGGSPVRHWLNGWTASSRQDTDKHSTLSRYWTIERGEPRQPAINIQQIRRLCREKGNLYEDTDFPATSRSISSRRHTYLSHVVWMRPHELCGRPKFCPISDPWGEVEASEHCEPWLPAALAALVLTPRLLERVVDHEQGFETGYCGAFRFRLWHFGEWREVVVDDRLPTHRGRLLFLRGQDATEFWAPLIEKAYAKFYGSYDRLSDGSTSQALQDLTGGIVQSFLLATQERFLTYQVLNSAVPRSSLLLVSIQLEREMKRQLRLRNGLMTQHVYCITGLARVRSKTGETPLVRLRSPWGRGEWTGPWSERSWEWDSLSERDKELLSVRVQNDGEFWMSFEDFSRHFTHLELVHVGPDDWLSEPALQPRKPWRAVLARRRWRAGFNAGGSPDFADTTAMNPQFRLQIPRTAVGKCHVVISVTQHYESCPPRKSNGSSALKAKLRTLHHIGFAIYEVPPNSSRMSSHFVTDHRPLDVTRHSSAREVATFFALPPGDYVVVPHTLYPDCEAKFLLRILTDEQSNIWEVNEDNLVFRNFSLEFFEEGVQIPEYRTVLTKMVAKYPAEVDAFQLLKILKTNWKAILSEKPSLELSKSLVMLRDFNISGRVSLLDVPILLHMLHIWRAAFQKFDRGRVGKASSYVLRPLLWEAGLTVSNKVLECLVLRFARNSVLQSEAFVLALLRLHLAHERYHSIDTKMKSNPLSLEEVILMTIYS